MQQDFLKKQLEKRGETQQKVISKTEILEAFWGKASLFHP